MFRRFLFPCAAKFSSYRPRCPLPPCDPPPPPWDAPPRAAAVWVAPPRAAVAWEVPWDVPPRAAVAWEARAEAPPRDPLLPLAPTADGPRPRLPA